MSKIELVWNEDPRSIGILEETEDGSDTNFKPLIMFNFVLLGYISCGDHPYRGYQLMVKTHGGNEFRIVVTEREIQSFSLFVNAVKMKTHGEIIQYASFDTMLWTEMIPKLMLDYPNLKKMRPASNWGTQYRTLVVNAPGDKSKLLRQDLEIVYPGAVYDGWGRRTSQPVHVVVPELMGNMPCRILSSVDSGLSGLMERFIPPFTSSDPETRDQQAYGLCAFIGIHNYRLIVDCIGGCPGLTFISTEPGTLKTDTSKQGALLGGDTGFILTSTSSDPAIESAQCQASWVTVHDDAESSRGTHNTYVGGYGAGTKGLVTKSTNNEKVGGVCKTENLTTKKVMNPKIVEGREIIIHMMKNMREASAKMTHSERYDARRIHLKAMSQMTLPRDYMAAFTGKHFTYESVNEEDISFVHAHKVACDLLSEVRPGYGDRRLGSQAIPLAVYLLIEKDVEENDSEDIKALFVEAFGDKERFFNVCVRELEKAEIIIEKHMIGGNELEENSATDDDNLDAEVPENEEDKIHGLLDLLKGKDLVTMTKYIKVFNQGGKQILGIAHAKMNADFDQAFKKMKLKPDEDTKKHVKSFTDPKSDQMSGSGSMKATSCKIFFIKKFTMDFREKLLNLFNMEEVEDVSDEETSNDGQVAQSQDFPMHSQSRNTKTLRICSCCKFRSREETDFAEHMKEHSKCGLCGLFFENESSLSDHHKAFHAKIECTKCGKEILENRLEKHMNGHKIEKGYSKVVSKGKVKASGNKNERTETKEVKTTGYRLFTKTKRPEIKNLNPDATPQELMVMLNSEWRKEKIAGRMEYWQKRAKEADKAEQEEEIEHVELQDVFETHRIKKCPLCPLMIANLNAHMSLAHPQPIEVLSEDAGIEEASVVSDISVPVEVAVPVEDISIEQESKFKVGDVAMVQRKTLHWPCKILDVTNKQYKYMIYDKARTEETKNEKYFMTFSTNASVCDGRGPAWINAWKAAKAEYMDKS